jgi:CBS domain-containing protein
MRIAEGPAQEYQLPPDAGAQRMRTWETTMIIEHVRTPNVVVTHPDEALAEAARMMRDKRVGALVVLDRHDPLRKPQGILTDRDIVQGQVIKGADLHCLTVGDVMTRNPLVLRLSMSLSDGIEALRSRGVRRAPVVDPNGSLVGIVTLDDLLPALASNLHELARLMGTQARNHRRR